MDEAGTGRRVRSDGAWAAAQAEYLAGMSAGEVCRRYDLGLSALRARARRDGWRRSDQADPDPQLDEDLDEELEADGPADFTAMAERAARLTQRALALGDARAAEGWMRLYVKLRPLAAHQRDETAAPQRSPEPDRAAEVHLVHSVHHDLECTSDDAPPPARPQNRADRRRQARLAAYQAAAVARAGTGQGP